MKRRALFLWGAVVSSIFTWTAAETNVGQRGCTGVSKFFQVADLNTKIKKRIQILVNNPQ